MTTARDAATLDGLKERFGEAVLPLTLDVTNVAQVRQAVAQAYSHFGRLDVVLNNAGYSLVGTVEEVSEEEVRAQFDTNFFGTLRVIQAALPLLAMPPTSTRWTAGCGTGSRTWRWPTCARRT